MKKLLCLSNTNEEITLFQTQQWGKLSLNSLVNVIYPFTIRIHRWIFTQACDQILNRPQVILKDAYVAELGQQLIVFILFYNILHGTNMMDK